jgi:nitroimidazol reductase NimA-like FMN-containing flavoprotein (pyridoxamine 5'-phosphate oxidase superfamily)
MSEHVGEALKHSEIMEFLQDRGLGTLGLTKGGEAYTIPIAFAYDNEEKRCIFRFIMAEESRKREFVAETEVASLTAYQWKSKNQWLSVVIRGPIHQMADSELGNAAALLSSVGNQAAAQETFNESLSEYETVWCELEAEEITGRGRYVGSRASLV